jgi:hypothetical protein
MALFSGDGNIHPSVAVGSSMGSDVGRINRYVMIRDRGRRPKEMVDTDKKCMESWTYSNMPANKGNGHSLA